MTNGEILKWNRRQQKLSQAELADILGMSTQMIGRYERDHTSWAVMKDETVDKITAWIESVGGWELKLDKKPETVHIDTEQVDNSTDIEDSGFAEVTVAYEEIIDGLGKEDKKALKLINCAYDELKMSENHDELIANMKLLKGLLKILLK